MSYFSLEVTTTQKCDMACSYCFEGDELQNNKKQDIDISKTINDLLESKSFNEIYTGVKLDFWGGEPTLNTKLIFELIEEFKHKNVNFFFYTNGYNALNLVSIINKFKDSGINLGRFNFQISYDGISHDQERVDHSGKGTQDRVLSTIRHISKMFPEVTFSLKSTLPIHELPNIIDHWNHFKELHDEMLRYHLQYYQHYL